MHLSVSVRDTNQAMSHCCSSLRLRDRSGARADGHTTWPDGFDPVAAGATFSAAIPAATGVAHGDTARHRPGVEWAVQSTNNPTGDPRGPTYGSEGWGFESL